MILETENISKSFGKKQVLRSVSIRIDEAEIVGLFGESGCGKSTFAKIICGLCEADGGSLTRLDRRVQMVYQQPWSAMDPSQRIGKSIEEIIKYNKLADGKEEISKLLDQSLAELGLSKDIKKQLPKQISGGEAQRVSLAKALLFKPKLLVLDEATSMLDVQTQAEIIEIIKKIKNEKKCGVLLISHDMEFMQDVCDRIYILENGETRNYENA